MQVRFDVVERVDAEDAALSARVRRLQHRREADLVRRAPALRQPAQRREARLRHAGVREPPPHRHLVRHQVRRLDADPRQVERLGDRCDDRDGPVGRDRQHAVEPPSAHRPQNGLQVCEVDDLRDICLTQTEGIRIAVDGSHPQPELLRALDRPPLMATRADEEDGLLHERRCYLRHD